MVSAAFRTGHRSHLKNIFRVTLAHLHIVRKTPMLGPRMHPSCFQAIFLSEDCIRNRDLVLSANLEQVSPIAITVAKAAPTKD